MHQTPAAALARPSGGLAMLALDQREALRILIADGTGRSASDVPDAALTEFKVTATEVLSPYASAVLVDHRFAWDAVLESKAVDRACALISAADLFIPSVDEFVADSVIDRAVDFARVRAQGAAAVKLLVIWRPDGDPDLRKSMILDFVTKSKQAGLASILEPISRPSLNGGAWDRDEGILKAAQELGCLGADVYKAEVPTLGRGTDAEIEKGCHGLTEAVCGGVWVVLSSGVDAERFPHAVALACRQGARGFLAGRAVWASVVGASDLRGELLSVSVDRLLRLAEVVDDEVRI